MQDRSCIFDLHHSSQQRWIPDSLSGARDRTHILMYNSRIRFHCATTGTPLIPIFFFGLFAISWAAPAAYGDSQARGPIGAVATGLHQSHSNVRSEPRLQPTPQLGAVATGLHHSSWQRRIVNPLSKGRDRTHNLMVPSWIR